jgi:hypothetical protein
MSPFEYLQNHVVSIIKPSSIGGVGLFAVRDIKEGESLFEVWPHESGVYSITHDELHRLPEDLKTHIYHTFSNDMVYHNKMGVKTYVEKDYDKIFFPLEFGYHWIYTWPKTWMNSGLNKANTHCISSNNSIAKVDIKRGQELLAEYGKQFKTIPRNFI